MKRNQFVRICGLATAAIPLGAGILQSCSGLYYAKARTEGNITIVSKQEFLMVKKERIISREFVLVKTFQSQFPICLYKMGETHYVASLLRCTHKGCELNVGGGGYSCPCHGSEFTKEGKVLEGPAIENLKTYEVTIDDQNIYIHA